MDLFIAAGDGSFYSTDGVFIFLAYESGTFCTKKGNICTSGRNGGKSYASLIRKKIYNGESKCGLCE
jgi:hypothetical protein